MSSGDVNMGAGGLGVDNTNLTNVPTMGGPNSMLTEAAIVGQRPRITDAMGNPQGSQMFGMQERMRMAGITPESARNGSGMGFGVAPPIEGTAEAGGVLGGAPAPSYNFTYDQAVWPPAAARRKITRRAGRDQRGDCGGAKRRIASRAAHTANYARCL